MELHPPFIVRQTPRVPSGVAFIDFYARVEFSTLSYFHEEIVRGIRVNSREVLGIAGGLVMNLKKNFNFYVRTSLLTAFAFGFEKNLNDLFNVVEIELRRRQADRRLGSICFSIGWT